MLIKRGNVWQFHNPGIVTIPISWGWKKNGEAVLGRGLAFQAAKKFLELPRRIGQYCETYHGNPRPFYYSDLQLLIFPTKPLDKQRPWLSWQQPASLKLIKQGIDELLRYGRIYSFWATREFYLPLLGCGNGQLDPVDVFPVISVLPDNYSLVLPKNFDEQKLYKRTITDVCDNQVELPQFMDSLFDE